jgi:hypothetical protein
VRRLAAWLATLLWPALAGGEPGLSIDLTDPQATPSERRVSEARWAGELSHELGLERRLPVASGPAENFALLCGDQAERSLAAGGRRMAERGAFRVSREAPRPRKPGDPVRMVLQLPATTLYQLTVEGVGTQRWVIDGKPVGHLDLTPLGVAQAAAIVPLTEGAHEVTAYLSRGARVDRMELSAYRSLCVAPADGWHAERALTHGAMARTLVRAFDFDRRLPERKGETFVIEGERFDSVTAGGDRTHRKLTMASHGDGWAEATHSPAEFTWEFTLEEPRVISIEARTHGVKPQIWAVDGRYRVTVQPEAFEGGFAWNHVLTLPLGSGRHALRALVSRGSGVDAVRFVPHRSGDRDYVRVLEGLGFQGGAPSAPVARSAALSVLESSAFAELAGGFRMRMAGDARDRPLVLVDSDPAPFRSRPLSPLLPGEL